jgi:hypothetical protein
MNSSFFITGPGVRAGKAVGAVDMRSIAPTLATFLGVELSAAEKGPLELN